MEERATPSPAAFRRTHGRTKLRNEMGVVHVQGGHYACGGGDSGATVLSAGVTCARRAAPHECASAFFASRDASAASTQAGMSTSLVRSSTRKGCSYEGTRQYAARSRLRRIHAPRAPRTWRAAQAPSPGSARQSRGPGRSSPRRGARAGRRGRSPGAARTRSSTSQAGTGSGRRPSRSR
jgi:hypothetical protein